MTHATSTESPTRTKLLDAAEALMLSKGFAATSIDEICRAAGVTKGSFFHYFADKEALGTAVLAYFNAKQQAILMGSIASIEDPLDRVYALLETCATVARDPASKGCLAGTFAQELSETHPVLRDACGDCFRGFVEAIGRDLAIARDRVGSPAAIDSTALAACLMSLVQGTLVVRKATGDLDLMRRNLIQFKLLLKSLYGR